MTSVVAVARLVEQFEPARAPRAVAHRRRTLVLLRTAERPLDRACFTPGHLTASAVVLETSGHRVALVWHERFGRWLQPGGHFEPDDAGAVQAARREAREELGVTLPDGPARLVGVDVHRIPAGRGEPAHCHHDLVFAFRVPDDTPLAGETRAEWCPIDDLAARGADEPLRRAVARARLRE